MRRRTAAAAAGILVLGVLAAARVHTQGQPGAQDIMPALLAEVRGLRAAMEQMATAGARVQLALGRVQLQEQRVNTAIRRLDEARTRLTQLQRAAADQDDQLAMMESALRQGKAENPEEQRQIEFMLGQHKRQVARHAAEIQQLTADEVTLANEVANEQARWVEFNQRLEELERALGR